MNWITLNLAVWANPAAPFLGSAVRPRCSIGVVAAAEADRVAAGPRLSPAKSTLWRCCGSTRERAAPDCQAASPGRNDYRGGSVMCAQVRATFLTPKLTKINLPFKCAIWLTL